MKTSMLWLWLASAALLAFAADNPPLSGKWQIHTSAAGHESEQACTFAQKGSDLTGSCDTEQGTVQINGKVDEKKVSWVYKTEYNGSPLTVTFKGTVDSGTKISGSVRAEEYDVEGEFTATASK